MIKVTNTSDNVQIQVSGVMRSSEVLSISAGKTIELDESLLIPEYLAIFSIFGNNISVEKIAEQQSKTNTKQKDPKKDSKQQEPQKQEEEEEEKKDTRVDSEEQVTTSPEIKK